MVMVARVWDLTMGMDQCGVLWVVVQVGGFPSCHVV